MPMSRIKANSAKKTRMRHSIPEILRTIAFLNFVEGNSAKVTISATLYHLTDTINVTRDLPN